MLERRRSPASRTYEGDVPVLAGSSSVGQLGPERSTERARLLLGPSNLHPKTPTPASTPSSLHAESLALTSIVHRAARVFRRHPAFGYIAAFAFVGIATALQWLGREIFQGAPFVAAYPAIALAGLLGGYRPGLLAAALAGMAQWYLFIPEFHLLRHCDVRVRRSPFGISLIAYINRTLEKENPGQRASSVAERRAGPPHAQSVRGHSVRHPLQPAEQQHSRFPEGDRGPSRWPDAGDVRRQSLCQQSRPAMSRSLDLVRGQMRGLGNRIIIHGRPASAARSANDAEFFADPARAGDKFAQVRRAVDVRWPRSHRPEGNGQRRGLRLDRGQRPESQSAG